MDKKLGPLKTWQWIAIAGAAGLLYWYEKKKSETTTTSEVSPSESFATGNEVGQSTGGSGAASEQPAPATSASNNTEAATAPGLGAGQLFATELEEVKTGREALANSGLIPPSEGANNSAVKSHAEKEHTRILSLEKTVKKLRKPATHAKAGSHASKSTRSHTKEASPHAGARRSSSAHNKPSSAHSQKSHTSKTTGSAHKTRTSTPTKTHPETKAAAPVTHVTAKPSAKPAEKKKTEKKK